MKNLFLLFFFLLFCTGFPSASNSAEFRPFLQLTQKFIYGEGGKNISKPNFEVANRFRYGFDYITDKNLSATMLIQLGIYNFGTSPNFPDDPEAMQKMRLAYLDWTIPNTAFTVRMGRQPLVAPSYAFGSAILDGRGDALSIFGKLSEHSDISLTWMRLLTNDNKPFRDEADALMITNEYKYDSFKIVPWGMYFHKDKNANMLSSYWGPAFSPNVLADANAFVLGTSYELMSFCPMTFAVDALYNYIDYSRSAEDLSGKNYQGYYVGADASYHGENGTISAKAWYATGNDSNDNRNGFIVLDGNFVATNIFFGDDLIFDYYSALSGDTPFGTKGAMLSYANFQFFEKIKHTARIAYITGTNSPSYENKKGPIKLNRITDDDKLVEINFNSNIEIYKTFFVLFELGSLFITNSDEAYSSYNDDIHRAGLTFVYLF